MLLNIPLPSVLMNTADSEQEENQLPACFPVVGAIVGIMMYVIAWLVSFFFPASASAAVIGAIILSLITESITCGGNISTLTAFIRAWQNKLSNQEILSFFEQEGHHDSTTDLILFLSLYLLKIFCIGLFIYHERTSWLIVVFTMSYLIRSQMATWKDLRTSQPMIEADDEILAIKLPWGVAILISLIVGISYLPAVLIILFIAYLLIKYFRKITEDEFGGVNGLIIGTAGTVAELIFLVAGIAMLRN